MSTNTKLNQVYGIQNPQQTVTNKAFISNRDPESTDIAAIGQAWYNRITKGYFVFTSYGVWSNQTTGAASQATLEITGASGTVFTVDTGDSSLGGDLAVTGDTTLTGDLAVTGDTTLTGTFIANGGAAVSTLSVGGVDIIVGAGSPSGSVTAPVGSLYLNSTGATTTTRLYINIDAGTTWAHFTASA